ncbi:TIGR02186 family protein [Phyllobacterium phragmitis]|uniref:TIGR02186 family protein n=1 Tax=Phyllobacterium phragmitis TaxID=2670329 RepID=A0A2S9IKI0_9HYPH|nr:TIGR02186 family protein [Phyllobacterium phragmitis]PRD41015.1 TIGR02186 family protein [Phyllobacterium phragmitis]
MIPNRTSDRTSGRIPILLFRVLLAGGIVSGAASAALSQAPQPGETPTSPPNSPSESIEIGLSTETIAITSNFRGTNLTIFGALDNADPLIRRQGRYDIIVVLQGPERDLVVRKKERYLGVWVNAESQAFIGVPLSYSLASTRNLQDITEPQVYRQLSIGVDNFYMAPEPSETPSPDIQQFSQELREIKTRQGLYSQRIGDVEFISQTLFRATLSLPTNVPVGRHIARALLFRNGTFLREANARLQIVKAGLEYRVYEAAQNHSFLYGVFAVFLAVITGWFGRLLFRKD